MTKSGLGETDARRLVPNLADTLIDVSDGEVEVNARADVEQSFTEYLAGADYHAWDDIASLDEPDVRRPEHGVGGQAG